MTARKTLNKINTRKSSVREQLNRLTSHLGSPTFCSIPLASLLFRGLEVSLLNELPQSSVQPLFYIQGLQKEINGAFHTMQPEPRQS